MARRARLDYPGARHHVMNRGARRESFFRSDQSCILFPNVLSEMAERYHLEIDGYVLMPNHYHLMVRSVCGNLSDGMRHLGGEFSRKLNRMHSWDGPVFRGRFNNRVVEEDAYWRHLLAYIHLNPVRAHLVSTPEKWMLTSHHAYLGTSKRPAWLRNDELLSLYGSRMAYLQHIRDLQLKRAEIPKCFHEANLWTPECSETASPIEPRRPPDLDSALAQVCQVYGRCPRDLEARKTGKEGQCSSPSSGVVALSRDSSKLRSGWG